MIASEVSSKNASIELDEYNSRIKLMRYTTDDLEALTKHLEELANEKDIGKVLIYADPEDIAEFEKLGFEQEGEISVFFNGEPAFILSRFIDDSRSVSEDGEKKDQIIEIAEQAETIEEPPPLDPSFTLRRATPADAKELAGLYQLVFETYPTPIHDEKFIRECMEKDVYFTVVTHENKIVSAASADVFTKYNCAEITDCATNPEYRGKGLLSAIIFDLEKRMQELGVPNLFSLTRAVSTGMNVVISKLGFEYQGRLIQNSQIAGQFEDMNIWVKKLSMK
ncbi:putative beta-lysine N-acetyltransferase [Paenactinomyces guangxiensis]|uniref:Putative beta-lysine N-acetyltransferase n=1 Tax=Paenactinomyces guangxiensis TaxID=1490290 RepID=A0A7W2A6W4_9BACL|nr:putative beta-lysine N-acetyltransferase [Paenactinomyces guangxiensis]MBA4493861.1 putative beta-lysine N-acetyltransferase [Paenactinomyces guangxiensis]MBH8591327.1 putative beta-lysine N-acetyltransferase [Paenactinomyces guangxiensis]